MAEYIYEYKYGNGYVSAGVKQQLVQCRDCKYFKTYPPTEDQDYTIYDCERLNYCTDNAVGNKPDDFCSRGERREDGE